MLKYCTNFNANGGMSDLLLGWSNSYAAAKVGGVDETGGLCHTRPSLNRHCLY